MKRTIRAYAVRYRRETAAILAAITVVGVIDHIAPLHTSSVVVATRHIEGGALISSGDLELRHSLITWSTAVRDAASIAGTRAMRDIAAGQPLSQDDVADPAQYAAGDRVAVSVSVEVGDARLVRPGDTVDLLASSDSGTSTVAAGAGVISVQGSTGAGIMASASSSSVVLAVTATEARDIAGAREQNFTVVLRNRL